MQRPLKSTLTTAKSTILMTTPPLRCLNMTMTTKQLKLARMAYRVVDGKIPFEKYREAEKKLNKGTD
jgi:hypothetical protein